MEYAVKHYTTNQLGKPLSTVRNLCASCEVNIEAELVLFRSARCEGVYVGTAPLEVARSGQTTVVWGQ
jgi:hypothetical protein